MPVKGSFIKRSLRHIRKWIGAYIAVAAVLFLANELLFGVTDPRLPEDAVMRIMMLDLDHADTEALDTISASMLEAIQAADEGIQEVVFEDASASTTAYREMILAARLMTNNYDLALTLPDNFENLAEKGVLTDLTGTVSADDPRALSYTDPETHKSGIYALKLTVDEAVFGTDTVIAMMMTSTSTPETALLAFNELVRENARTE